MTENMKYLNGLRKFLEERPDPLKEMRCLLQLEIGEHS